MPPLKTLRVEGEDGVATVTIDRTKQSVTDVLPNCSDVLHRGNTFTGELCDELIQTFEQLDRDDSVRVIVLTADPSAPAFCSGADLADGFDKVFDPNVDREGPLAHRDPGGQFTLRVAWCRKLTIAAINGHAAGVGATMMLPFDFRIAWQDAKIVFPFVQRGVTPEAMSTYFLPRLVGHAAASALLLTGDAFTPHSHSHLLGSLFYATYLQRTDVLPAALALARRLASRTSAPAIALTKALIWRGTATPEGQHLIDSRVFRYVGQRDDAREGVKSFKEKRAPVLKETLDALPPWYPWWHEYSVVHRKAKL